jgi:hypothetical protein
MTSTAAAVLMQRLGLSDDELLQVLGADPLSVVGGDLDDKPQLPILLALTEEAAGRVHEDALRRWVRTAGPGRAATRPPARAGLRGVRGRARDPPGPRLRRARARS